MSAERCPTPSWSRAARRCCLPASDAVAQMKGLATPLQVKPSGMPPCRRRAPTVLVRVRSQASSTGGTSAEQASPPTAGPPPGGSAADLRGARGPECSARGLSSTRRAPSPAEWRERMRRWGPTSAGGNAPASVPGGSLGGTPRPSPVRALTPRGPPSGGRWARTGGPEGPAGRGEGGRGRVPTWKPTELPEVVILRRRRRLPVAACTACGPSARASARTPSSPVPRPSRRGCRHVPHGTQEGPPSSTHLEQDDGTARPGAARKAAPRGS